MRTAAPSKLASKQVIIVAIIGLVGTLGAAILSNLDKILGKPVVAAEYIGYKPTGDFETELRYNLEITGVRKQLKAMLDMMLNLMEQSVKQDQPNNPQEVSRFMQAVRAEPLRYDDLVEKLVPIYKKYFTVNEIQELNKFYSTPTMRNMTSKLPEILKEVGPIAQAVGTEWQERVERRLKATK